MSGWRTRGSGFATRVLVLALGLSTFASLASAELLLAQVTPTPVAQDYRGAGEEFEYRGAFTDIALAINNHWSDVFRGSLVSYVSPSVIPLDRSLLTGCGRHGPEAAAFYCPLDRTIYLNPNFLAERERTVGDYAPIIVLAHEWGHHVQHLLLLVPGAGNEFELQADCLAGVYSRKAEDQNWLEPGDFLEALVMSESAGDPLSFPQDAPGAHGTYLDRRNAVMRGYLDGVTGCGLAELAPVDSEVIDASTQSSELLLSLPNPLPLPHAACFGIVDDGTEDISQVLDRFAGIPDASTRLQDWGWLGSAFRQFGCDGPPEGEAGWIDVSLHLFADAASAQEAVDYFTAVRLEGSPHIQGVSPSIGDYSTAMSGPEVNGKDFTVYASQGPILIRVTGVSPSGIPFMNVLTVANSVLAEFEETTQTTTVPATQPVTQSALAYLPASLAVRHADCFSILAEGTYPYAEVAAALQSAGLSQAQFDTLGWQDGAYRVFRCDSPPFGRAAQLDVVVQQFTSAESASVALPYLTGTYAPGRNQSRSCNAAGALVVCVTGIAESGSPLSDVAFVLQQVTSTVR